MAFSPYREVREQSLGGVVFMALDLVPDGSIEALVPIEAPLEGGSIDRKLAMLA